MKSLVFFISLILFILALEETPDKCDYLSTVNKVKNLFDCQQILKDDTEIKFGLFRLGKKNEKEIYEVLNKIIVSKNEFKR